MKMNMQDVLFVLENEEKRKDFILRLKQAGEISEEFQAIKNAMSSLGVNKPPREVNQTTILRHAFQYCDGIEAFQSFRLVSKSWKLAVETTTFYAPYVHGILVKITKKFGQGQYPVIYHKLLKNLKPNPSNFFFYRGSSLFNNFNSIAKLVSKNMKGLRSISIGNGFDVIGNEIYKKFIIEFLSNSRNTLCELQVPKLFLPNVCFPNLSKLKVTDLNLSFDIFKTQFEQILKNVPDLKIIQIDDQSETTPIIRNYVISNYAEQCLVSFEKIVPFPVKIICNTDFSQLVSDCQFKFCLQYVKIWIDVTEPDEANWNNFKNNIYDFSKLKGIQFCEKETEIDTFMETYCETITSMEESNFYKSETPEYPEKFYNIWPNRIKFLKSHGIQILHFQEFDSTIAELSKNIKWAFHFRE